MRNSFMCSCCVYIVGCCYLFWYQECKSWVTWKLFQNGQCPWRSVCAVCTLLAYLPTLISICLLVYTDSRDCVQLYSFDCINVTLVIFIYALLLFLFYRKRFFWFFNHFLIVIVCLFLKLSSTIRVTCVQLCLFF